MKKLTKEQLEAIELCQLDEKGTCENCPAIDCDYLKDAATTTLLLLAKLEVKKC